MEKSFVGMINKYIFASRKNNVTVVLENRERPIYLSWLEQLICNQQVVGSSPSIGSSFLKYIEIKFLFEGGYSSGQRGQTVNLLVFTFAGSNPAPPTFFLKKIQIKIQKTIEVR